MPQLSIENMKAGIFESPQIGQLIKDPDFINLINESELKAWTSFVAVIENLSDNAKLKTTYFDLVNETFNSFNPLCCNTSVKKGTQPETT